MSCFGQIHVSNAYLSASVSDSLRESMGFCNQFVDVALSVLLPVNERPVVLISATRVSPMSFRAARYRSLGPEMPRKRKWLVEPCPAVSLQQWKRWSGMMMVYKATHGCNHSVQAAKITLSFTRETRMNE